jgi:hypothetical protein
MEHYSIITGEVPSTATERVRAHYNAHKQLYHDAGMAVVGALSGAEIATQINHVDLFSNIGAWQASQSIAYNSLMLGILGPVSRWSKSTWHTLAMVVGINTVFFACDRYVLEELGASRSITTSLLSSASALVVSTAGIEALRRGNKSDLWELISSYASKYVPGFKKMSDGASFVVQGTRNSCQAAVKHGRATLETLANYSNSS